MNALAEIVFGLTQRRPRPFGAQGKRDVVATGALRYGVAKYSTLRSFGPAELRRDLRMTRALAFFVLLTSAEVLGGAVAGAQNAQGPLTPAPSEEHKVRRLGGGPGAAAPPSLPPDEIIRRFSQKESGLSA